MAQGEMCEYCGKQPLYVCAQCKWTAYCSREHQLQHWRVHKQHCNIVNSYRLRVQQKQMNEKRAQLRKKFFQNFTHKIYDGCIKIALELVQIQKKHIKTTRQIFNEMQYGISICLLARSWINVRNQGKAIILMQNYLQDKQHFLKDMRDIVNFQILHKNMSHFQKLLHEHDNQQVSQLVIREEKQLDKSFHNQDMLVNVNGSANGNTSGNKNESGNVNAKNNLIVNENLLKTNLIVKQFAIKKVSLIASVANIMHVLKQPVIKLYEMYTHHIQKMFGRDSYEASNCFFMMGSYFMEKHQYNKSIACYMRASELRGNMAGDCYYNLGIIYHLLRKPEVALMMFQNAAKLRQNQFSQNSSEVADVYHNLALINQSLGDFKSAIQNLQKIALIYSKDKSSHEYKKAKQSIKILQNGFRKHMQKNPNINIGIYNDLKKGIRKAMKPQDDMVSQQSYMEERQLDFRDKMGGDGQNFMKITQPFLNKLNPLQVFYLSQLQIELGRCQTIYMAANTVGASHFLRVLKLSSLQQLMKQNEILFKNVSIEKLSKRGIMLQLD